MTRLGSFPKFLKKKSVGGSVLLEFKPFGLAFTPNPFISDSRSKIAIDGRFLGGIRINAISIEIGLSDVDYTKKDSPLMEREKTLEAIHPWLIILKALHVWSGNPNSFP